MIERRSFLGALLAVAAAPAVARLAFDRGVSGSVVLVREEVLVVHCLPTFDMIVRSMWEFDGLAAYSMAYVRPLEWEGSAAYRSAIRSELKHMVQLHFKKRLAS